jgi:endonuclease/exonuclease/phosphatase (EEP) superfamily protein YafD
VDQLIEDLARRPGPVIVAGDFNTTGQSDAYLRLTRHLLDAHRQAGRGFGHTFPAYQGRFYWIPILPRLVRIDMILHSAEWTAVESRVLREHGQSDHLPVLARLAWSQ